MLTALERPLRDPADLPLPGGVAVEHRWVDVDGLSLHYGEAGSGEPLVLLHGWPQHWWCWRHVIGPLAERYRVICPDLRGMGWSEGAERDYSWHAMARDVAELLDAIGVGEVRVVGHDWGLVAGYRMAFNWPERVRELVALGGIHPWTLDGAPSSLWLKPWHIPLIAATGEAALRRMWIVRRCLRAWRHVGEFTREEMGTYLDVMRMRKCADATRRFDRNVIVREVPHYAVHYMSLRNRVRTLHLNGDHDALTRGVPDSYRKYADDMRLELVPDCGHFIAEERPEWLLQRLERFLT